MRKVKSIIFSLGTMFFVIAAILYIPFFNSTEKVYAGTTDYNGKQYTTGAGSDMAYYTSSDVFDIIGKYNGSWKQVTYSTNGFSTILTVGGAQHNNIRIDGTQVYDGIKVNVTCAFAKDQSLQIVYNVNNTSTSAKTISFGSHADVQIGTNDKAPITPFSNRTSDEKTKGFMMSEAEGGAQFNFYAREYSGVTTVDSLWYGAYGSRTANIYNEGSGNKLTGIDSGMAWSWKNREIPAGGSQTYKVKFIIAEPGSENNVASSGTISLIRIGDIQHTFKVYQLMEGTVDDKNTYNSVLKWKSGITSYKMKDSNTVVQTTEGSNVSIPILKEFVDSVESQQKGELVERMTLGEPIRTGTSSNGSIAFPNLKSGYYLIRDVTQFQGEDADIVSRDILVYLSDEGLAIEIKRAKPTYHKYVSNDGVTGNDWVKATDYGFGEEFKIKLTASLPANEDFGGYTAYKIKFTEKISDKINNKGISSVTYKIGDGAAQNISSDQYTVDTTDSGFTITINNLKALVGSNWGSKDNGIEVDVIYNASLKTSAPVITETVKNTPYSGDDSKVSHTNGYMQYTNNATTVDSLGKTSAENIAVFSYKILNTKYGNFAKDGYQLDGAKFKIYKNTKSDENEIKMIYDADLEAYRPAGLDEQAVDAMISGYGLADDSLKGKLDIAGIDSGEYVIVETEAPDGYTAIDDLNFTFVATPEANAQSASDILVVRRNNEEENSGNDKTQLHIVKLNNSIIDTIVSNSLLPETGGIGTIILYIVGIIMVSLAGVILIVRKRFSRVS